MEYRFLLQSTMVESAIAWVAKNIPYVASLWYLSIFFIILLWGAAERCSRIFKIASVQETSKIVMWYSLEVLNVFITLLLKHNFRKSEIFFFLNGVPFFTSKYYGWKRTISYQTALSKANVKTNWLKIVKQTNHRVLSLTTFFENLISL